MAGDSFRLIREQDIAELNARASLYRHRTGAELLSLAGDEENKVFGITFRTPPSDSTGVAHILEHGVLCGSRKYPVKEPFLELLKGSLNTFLNAFTYPDKTCYPVASQNLRDFYNLVDVYLDAVFYPRLTPQILQQEGWHYELEGPDDPLSCSGVVFNEMKGAYSSPDAVLAQTAQESLFPDTTYGVDSSGHPRHIPELDYQQFAAFHKRCYHPANARIFFYGDDDPRQRLALLEEYLDDFDATTVNSHIAPQPRFAAPGRLVRPYAAGRDREDEHKSMVALNWALAEDGNPETRLALNLVEHLLIGTPASPLRRALIESDLGEGLAGVGLDDHLLQAYFSTGLKGVDPGQVDAVEALVLETLAGMVQQGVEADAVEAALNTMEFGLRENNTGSYPRGLLLMLRALTTWLYDRDPFAALAFEAPMRALRDRAGGQTGYCEGLIRAHLLDNPHRTTLILEPDPDLAARQDAEERDWLDRTRAAMTPEQLAALVAGSRELKRRQETPDAPEALATLPHLRRDDLDPHIKRLPLEVTSLAETPVLYHDLFTNGIVYLDLGFDLHALPQEYLPYVPLFGRALVQMGTEKEDFAKLARRIGAHTGGIWPQTFVGPVRHSQSSVARLFLRGKAVTGRIDELLAITGDILGLARLDNPERFYQMALEEKAGAQAALVSSGDGVVSVRMRASFDEAGWVSEQMEGITYLFFLRQLVRDIEDDWPGVLARLEEIRRLLLSREGALCNVTLAEADRATLQPGLEELLATLPATPAGPADWTPAELAEREGLSIPAQVNFVGKATRLEGLDDEPRGSAAVVSRYLSTTWLWDRVRVQGGAYGASCSLDQLSGVFSWVSYRDPRLMETLETYDGSGRFLRELTLSEGELAKAIIGAISDADMYQLPDAKGYASMLHHLTGITDDFRQRIRDEILATTAADFEAFGSLLEGARRQGRIVVMGSPQAVQAARAAHGEPFSVSDVL